MILADTNVVVRFLIADDLGQFARARALIEAGDVLVPLTVILEAEWVLRSTFRYDPPQAAAALRSLVGLPGIAVEAPHRVDLALRLAAEGFDLADALHLAATPPGSAFATFDRDLVRRAQALGLAAREP